MKNRFAILLLICGFASVSLRAQDVNGDGYITYLLPLNVPNAIAGSFGSSWQTELWVYNGSNNPYNIQGCPGQIFDGIPLCSGIPFHSAGVTEKAFPYESGENSPSVFTSFTFTVFPSQNGVVVKSRLYELSRHAQPAGVEIPVIREDQFFTKSSRFIAIPGNRAVRAALRVYDPRHRSDAAVRVEVLDAKSIVIGTTTLSLIPQTIDGISPGYAAILDIRNAFPQLAEVDRYDLRVTPLVEGMEYWAFVSVTDQDTQTVLLVTADK